MSGGRVPETTSQRVMLRPDSVSRVMPPTTTMAKTIRATAASQSAMALGAADDAAREAGSDVARAGLMECAMDLANSGKLGVAAMVAGSQLLSK